MILLIVPGGFNEAFSKMSAPAERLEAPTDVDTVTYATEDVTETIKVFGQYGARFLTADEIRTGMPQYPFQAGGSSACSGWRPGRPVTATCFSPGSGSLSPRSPAAGLPR